MTGKVVVWLILGAVLLESPARAQGPQKPLTIETSSMQPSLVLGRPMLTWWDVKIQSNALLVGRFKFVIKSDQVVLGVAQSDELTLNGPEQRIRVLLPAIDSLFALDQLQVDISFQGKNFSGNLGEQILRVPFATKAVFIGLTVESSKVRKNSPRRDKLMDQLRFENVVPESLSYRNAELDREFIKTVYASIDPNDLPIDPLSYCSYDVVLVTGDEFQNLRKPQLEALLLWTRAGGSLYLEPEGVLEPHHLDFLRNLAADDPQGILFQLDSRGRFDPEVAVARPAAVTLTTGIGRAVIRMHGAEEIDPSDVSWRTATRALWKARQYPVEISVPPDEPAMNRNKRWAPQQFSTTDPNWLAKMLTSRSRLSQADLTKRLMPEGVRMVPVSLLAAILLVFVLLVGPGDYFVLGWLRMRKLTWLTFPLTSLGITALTVSLSNSYMSTAETRRAVVIKDLDAAGKVVRSNRFELLYIASSRWVATAVEKGLFAPLKSGKESPTPGTLVDDSDLTSTLTHFEGRIASHYSAIQNVAKWTPQVNRIFTIPDSSEKPEVEWDDFNLPSSSAETIRQHQVPPQLVERVQKAFGSDAMVACFTGVDGWASDRTPGWFPPGSLDQANIYLNRRYGDLMGRAGMQELFNARVAGESSFFVWLFAASVSVPGVGISTPHPGTFALISQTAPKGSGICDDLMWLDSTEPSNWLLVVVIPGNQETIVYRKLMRFTD